jgi:hypothetical protein
MAERRRVMGDDRTFDAMERLTAACAGLTTREVLDALELTWIAFAANARTEQLSIPGGFPEEQARQVQRLQRIAELVRGDEPDLELERLWQEGDHDGFVARVKHLMDDEKGGAR